MGRERFDRFWRSHGCKQKAAPSSNRRIPNCAGAFAGKLLITQEMTIFVPSSCVFSQGSAAGKLVLECDEQL